MKTQHHVALLRGINVGGKHSLPMKRLAAIFQEAGCKQVNTYIQSGNVVYEADACVAKNLSARIGRTIAGEFGFEVPVLTRTALELRAVADNNPLLEDGVDTSRLHVVFLAEAPAPERVAALDPERSGPDTFAVRGQEVYLHCPNGMARTKLTNAWFDSRLRTLSTVRNWRTVTRLLEMLELLEKNG